MTEPLYLALFIWALVHFSEFVQGADRRHRLTRSSSSLTNAALRGGRVPDPLRRLVAGGRAGPGSRSWWCFDGNITQSSAARLREFVLLAAAAPVLWLGYNAIVYRNPLEFANGPYSAKPSSKRALQSHPGAHDLPVAFSYFLKSAELNMTEAGWQKLWVGVLLVGR